MGVAFIGCFHVMSPQREHKVPLSIFVSSSKTNHQGKFRSDIAFSLTNTAL